MSVAELYENKVKSLSTADRLELAKLILAGIPREAFVDVSEEWTHDDLHEFSTSAWQRATEGEVHDDD